MPAGRDGVDAIVGTDREYELASLDRIEGDIDRDRQARWCGCKMRKIDVGSQCLFRRPVKVGTQQFDAGPLHQANHEPGCQYLRHVAEHVRLRIQVRDGLGFGNGECVPVRQARFE